MQSLNDKKICFITAVNRPETYNRSLRSWRKLRVPKGMTVESCVIQQASSLASAYQSAMTSSDAKYKIYIHQDVEIVDRTFLQMMVREFQAHPKLGLAGVVGSSFLPSNACWWEGHMLGAICDDTNGEMLPYLYHRSTKHYLDAEALDGLLLATQYDLPWREDLFDGWHFYDLSQCAEFHRGGYDVGVLPQREATCVHRCGNVLQTMDGFEEARQTFIKEYMS